MKPTTVLLESINQFRLTEGRLRSTTEHGRNGAFQIPHNRRLFLVIISDGEDWTLGGLPLPVWEHASISLPERTPTWAEMDYFKRLLWSDEELVIQFHVPRTNHINIADMCLHLWKPIGVPIPTPPVECV